MGLILSTLGDCSCGCASPTGEVSKAHHHTATRRERFCTTPHVEHNGPPRYVPPALRGTTETSERSQPPQTHCSNEWRDPPPHKDLPAQNLKCLDSLDWRTPSPNCPISFRSPSPPPQSPPAPPTSPLCPDIPPMSPKNITGSQLTSDLVSLIKTTSEALQNIVHIAAQLVRQANAERCLAHKSQQMAWSLHEDMHRNAVRSQPPAFPSGRGVPVTGSLRGLEAIA